MITLVLKTRFYVYIPRMTFWFSQFKEYVTETYQLQDWRHVFDERLTGVDIRQVFSNFLFDARGAKFQTMFTWDSGQRLECGTEAPNISASILATMEIGCFFSFTIDQMMGINAVAERANLTDSTFSISDVRRTF